MSRICIAAELIQDKLKLVSYDGEYKNYIKNGEYGVRLGDAVKVMSDETGKICKCFLESSPYNIEVDNNSILINNVGGITYSKKNCIYYKTDDFGNVKCLDDPESGLVANIQLRLLTDDEKILQYVQFTWGGRRVHRDNNESPTEAPTEVMHQFQSLTIHQNPPSGNISPCEAPRERMHYIKALVVGRDTKQQGVYLWTKKAYPGQDIYVRLAENETISLCTWVKIRLPRSEMEMYFPHIPSILTPKLHTTSDKIEVISPVLRTEPSRNQRSVVIILEKYRVNIPTRHLLHDVLGVVHSDKPFGIGTFDITVVRRKVETIDYLPSVWQVVSVNHLASIQ